MRTFKDLFTKLCDPDLLDLAADTTVRGKRRHGDIAWFLFRREDELERLCSELAEDRWRPEEVELILIRDPKLRLIARAPVADRVVHNALVLVMEPIFLPSLVDDAYACRKGYGTHRAVLRLLELIRSHRFVLHLDVKTYFPSVDLEILRGLLARRIRDTRFLVVVDRVLEAGASLYRSPHTRQRAGLSDAWPPPGRGLPIGASTSQLLAAQVYLDGFDHFVKRDLRIPGYVRYVDDMFAFGNRRADLRRWRTAIAEWLGKKRGLRLKHPEARILSCGGHLNALGYRISRNGLIALPRALRRLRRRLEAELIRPSGRVDPHRSIAATAGTVLF